MDFTQFEATCVEILQDAIAKAQFIPVGLIMEIPGHDKPVMMPFNLDERLMSMFNSETGKDILGDLIIPTVIRQAKATKAAVILDVWTVAPKEASEFDRHVAPRMNPDRIDSAVVQALDNEGAFGFRTFEIKRDEEGAAVSATEISYLTDTIRKAGDQGQIAGRFVDGIKQALADVKEGK